MSILVTPIALCTLLMLCYVAIREKQLREIFPFIFVEINMLFVWISTGAYFLFSNSIQYTELSFHKLAMDTMLSDAINLAPLNVFMYSWRFLQCLEKEDQTFWQKFLKWFTKISAWLIPITYYTIFIAFFLVNASSTYCGLHPEG